jgi:hypothetical protein
MKDHNKAKRVAKATLNAEVTIKPQAKGTANRTEAETQLERIKLHQKTKAARRSKDGLNVSYDAFNLERRAIPENKDTKLRYEPYKKSKFKRFGTRQ